MKERSTGLWKAAVFYRSHGFRPTGERRLEEGTPEYVLRLALGSGVAP